MEDPTLIIEGIAQSSSDAYEEKGIAYCVGYGGMEILQVAVPWAKISKSAEASKISKLEKAAAEAEKTAAEIAKLSEAKVKYFESLKNGILDDDAWGKLSKYAEEYDIDLRSKSFDWKLVRLKN